MVIKEGEAREKIENRFSSYLKNLRNIYQEYDNLWDEVKELSKQYGTNNDEGVGTEVKNAVTELVQELKRDQKHFSRIPKYIRTGYKWEVSEGKPVQSENQPFFDVQKGELFMAAVNDSLDPILSKRKRSSDSDWIHTALLPYGLISRRAFTADEQAFILESGYVDRAILMDQK